MEWTREKRYLPYEKWDVKTLLELQSQAARSDYQLHYHIRPTSGLLNDPNGFSYYNGRWQVFYQAYPFGAVHGLKSWVHLTSSDLVHWENLGEAVYPDTPLDSHGAYSGSAKAIGDKLFLMYTGNVRDENWVRHSYQVGAWMDEEGKVTKLETPLINSPEHVTEHFRDPQILEHDGKYYAILGAQDKETKAGKISLYKADAVTGPWQDLGYVDLPDMGYMVECPNLVFVDGKPVFIFCPQGLDKNVTDYQNVYPNMYWVGESFDFETGHFETKQKAPINLDEGFDVYATQAFNAPDGYAYAISWVGLPDMTYPSDKEGWANCLSQVKRLSLKHGRLLQKPVKAMKSLRGVEEDFTGDLAFDAGAQSELKLTIKQGQKGKLLLAADSEGKNCIKLSFKTGKHARLMVDRGECGQAVNPDYGTSRTVKLPDGEDLDLRIFVDHSLFEIFVNGGEEVITGRFFPQNGQTFVKMDSGVDYQAKTWRLKDM
ncbi:sucrose-6-phosphate hydrolase [Lactobacillus delbrueckii]|uniref:sucrose-6-phosphate hydrolase n=1 Tax=Lactobacillus delbrueckii TaxID=1584 RepID=UPI001F298E09|nr:sucrose-6-phosphate hydrolase [Lactobacillus delbrueckii]GHN40477.1 sucrose-6-phosphate hydrolase [Lactobacillus delbrueckii]GHN45511.1 sucrose-6-phosphate hydrolase [Lactobacillus delbrueckii]GHN56808.1 sucrose-6-phosphate hydrolase [Lactobacillus delbrueckii]GHN61192.1 sucrose-6-phosphate hydrolase [Lactobacillus delbrueckii]